MTDPTGPTVPEPPPTSGAGAVGPPPRTSRWTAGRVALVVIGSILSLIGLAALTGGAALAWAAATQRDDDGFFTTDTERFSSGTFAITSDDVDLGDEARPGDWGFDPGDLLRLRVRAQPADADASLFIGIARADDVDAYLGGVARDVVEEVDYDPFEVEYRNIAGDREPDPPQEQDIWVVSSEGSGRQTIEWELESGDWAVVLMNADASRGVVADVEVAVEVKHLWAITIVILSIGAVLLVGGVVLILIGGHRAHRPEPPQPGAYPSPAPAAMAPPTEIAAAPETAPPPTPTDPVALAGRLDEPLSRWLWLVKWILAIPHVIVLVFLWIAAIVMTVVAGVAILFTGRYPRGIFDFTVGVLRWTWRVVYYATSVLGTDRYPPFTLASRPDYPATLEVAYPERLSHGLVLVKWWVLAIPHYIVIGIIGTGWWWGAFDLDRDGWWFGNRGGGGLLGILVLVAGVRLLFTARYPREMYALLMGLNRWVFRVAAYALLMTDEYPPFRLDQGATGTENR